MRNDVVIYFVRFFFSFLHSCFELKNWKSLPENLSTSKRMGSHFKWAQNIKIIEKKNILNLKKTQNNTLAPMNIMNWYFLIFFEFQEAYTICLRLQRTSQNSHCAIKTFSNDLLRIFETKLHSMNVNQCKAKTKKTVSLMLLLSIKQAIAYVRIIIFL